jgi:soluble lytic murein transglycosylase
MGETPTALRILNRLQAQDPSGPGGDEARLMIATILMSERRHSEAIPLLERVAANGGVAPDYTQALLVEAIVEGGVTERLDRATAIAATQIEKRNEAQSPLLVERFAALLVKTLMLGNHYERASAAGVSYLAEWPTLPRSDEIRFLTAQAFDRMGRVEEAGRLYTAIWYDTPASPWAKQSYNRFRSLPSHAGGTLERQLTSSERLDFASRLQKAGFHEEALQELERVAATGYREDREKTLLMRAESLLAVRKNRECVKTVEQLRQLAPLSPATGLAGILAIQALRRTDDLAAIREWTDWLERTFAGGETATEARYNLAVYLQNTDHFDEATRLLLSVAATKTFAKADDALWKLVWAYREQGRTGEARAALEQLLSEFPNSGFRKAALYWLGRFSEEQDRGTAVKLYRELLREYPQDYYGHEAARNLLALQERVRWADYGDSNKTFPSIDPLDDPGRHLESDAYARAISLARVGLFAFAADELETVPGAEGDPSLAFALADLRTRAGDTWSGIEILKRHFGDVLVSGSRDTRFVPASFWYTAYPYNYRSLVEDAVREAGLESAKIEPALVAALIRMESRFHSTAVSPVGAVGLMQLMPGTAADLARKVTGSTVTRVELFDPEVNIRYGTRYLADRVADFKGEWFPAICSYNAGAAPVRRWWGAKKVGMPMDEFIESIPYEATRLYIKQVLADYRNYEWIYYQTSAPVGS